MLLKPDSAEFPLDLLAPGTEGDHVTYTNPGHGRIPERAVEGDYVMVPTYTVASSIDYLLRYAREARPLVGCCSGRDRVLRRRTVASLARRCLMGRAADRLNRRSVLRP